MTTDTPTARRCTSSEHADPEAHPPRYLGNNEEWGDYDLCGCCWGDATADECPGAAVELSSSATPREQFRVELLLQLPAFAGQETTADASTLPSGSRLLVEDLDYNQEALAAWILEQVDRLVGLDAFSIATAEAEALEQAQAEMIQLAGASSTFSAMAEWHSFLSKLHPILRRNMAIAEQWDLARTLEAEAARVQGVLLALIDRFPQLQAVLGDEVGRRAQGLVGPAGNDLSN